MKTLITSLLIISIGLQCLGQTTPLIKIGEEELGIKKLEITVEIVGNIATTTYDMQFFNPKNTILEGELLFPLGEGQNVSRFALDVSGILRESVVVEKEQGRIAFEAVVRRKVDPALLEKGTGNNYRAKIYPIPAKGYKRIVLAYEEELNYENGKHIYSLPNTEISSLERYNFLVKILNQNALPIIVSDTSMGYVFRQNGVDYNFEIKELKNKPSGNFLIEIPLANSTKVLTFKEYLYVYKTLENKRIKKELPTSINLFWDISFSMKDRDIEKEISFLDSYIKAIGALDIRFTSFSNGIVSEKNYQIKNGNWEVLKVQLRNSVYDGATSYLPLFDTIFNTDAILLFSDGMVTLSNFPKKMNKPVYIINSLQKANHDENKNLAERSLGSYINLVSTSNKQAIEKALNVPMYFLGYKSNGPKLELYPANGAQVYDDFSVSAKGVVAGQTIELQFGYNGTITHTEIISIPKSDTNSSQIARIWAQKKVYEFQKESDANRDKIVAVAKEYNLVTNHTSLIVLETVFDYITYNITPPADLLEQYTALMKGNKNVRVVTETNSEKEKDENESITEDVAGNNEILGSRVTVTGTILDDLGTPLLGVNVLVDGTQRGTLTDLNGNYSINVSQGKSLIFSYVGFATLESKVKRGGRMNIDMQSASELDEVIITALNIKREAKAIGYAISTVKSKELEQRTEGDIARVLSGKASGVQITSQSGMSGSATNVIIRGYNTITGNNQALFIVDGVPFSNDTNPLGTFQNGNVGSSRFLDIDPNSIEKITVLKGLAAATLYGSEGRNGVILITTKAYAGTNDNSNSSTEETSGSFETVKNGLDKTERIALRREKTIDEKIVMTSYLTELRKYNSPKEIYNVYLSQREQYEHLPAYFVDVYDYMKKFNTELANRILSNTAEIDSDNYELLKVLAYKLEEQGNYKMAVFIYRKVLKLRSEDSQSYRDLALALQEIGEFDEAVELLKSITSGTVYEGNKRRKFEGMESITLNELQNIFNITDGSLSKKGLPKGINKKQRTDLRIVIDWNHNDTDIDLHIIDSRFEECFYDNNQTSEGGKLSEDMIEGFGPEEFTQNKLRKGTYYVKVDYFGNDYQKVEVPTFMKVTIFRNYGEENQTKEVKVIRLTEGDDEVLISKIMV